MRASLWNLDHWTWYERDPHWGCHVQGTCEGGAATCCWDPWQWTGRGTASAPWPVWHTPVPSSSPSEKLPFQARAKGQMMQNGQKMMITAGRLWVWGLRERLCPCSLPIEKGLVYKRLVLGNQSPGSETCPPHFTQAWPHGQPLASCAGSLTRLPGGLLTSSGYLSSWHFAFLVFGLWSCTYPWASQAPHNLWPPGWWPMSCLGFLAPARAGLPPALCHDPHMLMCMCRCVWHTPHGVVQWGMF